ncbi:MAG TPA: hypothetical protein VMU81_13340 [Acetobacteraceae bacterium]|nr:hypothetical protein [Acetobacteraceae bacterium]
MTRSLAILLSLGVALTAVPAWAQNPQPAPPGVTTPPTAPPSAPSPPPEKIAPPSRDMLGGDNHNTFSDKLARREGTLQPPHAVDPGMVKQPPHGQGTMPVIPPPGSAGGDQHIVPK